MARAVRFTIANDLPNAARLGLPENATAMYIVDVPDNALMVAAAYLDMLNTSHVKLFGKPLKYDNREASDWVKVVMDELKRRAKAEATRKLEAATRLVESLKTENEKRDDAKAALAAAQAELDALA